MTQTMMVMADQAVKDVWREFYGALVEEQRLFRLYRKADERWTVQLDAQRELFFQSTLAYGRRLVEDSEKARRANDQALDALLSAHECTSLLGAKRDRAYAAYEAARLYRTECEGTLEEVCQRWCGTRSTGQAVTTVDEPPF